MWAWAVITVCTLMIKVTAHISTEFFFPLRSHFFFLTAAKILSQRFLVRKKKPESHIPSDPLQLGSDWLRVWFFFSGELYSVGLGDGGRLGTNNETTLVLPKKIYLTNKQKNERVKCVSTARNHSIALTTKDRIFTCGLNTHYQLGQRNSVEKSLIMRDIDIG